MIECANADAAMRACEQVVPDVALLDVMMPGTDGFTLCRNLRADPRLDRSVLVMMTASDQASERLRASDAGADHYLPKPFLPSTLPALVRRLLAERSGSGTHDASPPPADQA